MKIMRYRQRIVGDFTPDPEMGPWCRYKEVEPLLERIKELERYYNGDVVLLLERIKELAPYLVYLDAHKRSITG